jgi:formate dehydrogenase (coenzyme F420) beta subunit
MQNTEIEMRKAVKGLFDEKKVDVVIGFRAGSLPGTARPFFVRSAGEIDKLVWNKHCFNNLAVYLPKLFEKPARPPKEYKVPTVAIIAKGCDSRSIAGLIKEKQVPQENVIIIGMPCNGMMVSAKAGLDEKEEIAPACLECVNPVPQNASIMISGESRKPSLSEYARVKDFEKKPAEERWKIFVEEISKCIRCNACREACPNCYCKVCFADQQKPSWVSPANVLSETVVYHLGRMFHQAGRCVECDACVNACPMGIDLRLFTQKLAQDTKDLFGCVPGVTDDKVPPFYTHQQDDSECFITDPEEK